MTDPIQRWEFRYPIGWFDGPSIGPKVNPEGGWVTYADHAAEVAVLTASNEVLALAGQRNAQRLVAAEAELARVRERLAEAGP